MKSKRQTRTLREIANHPVKKMTPAQLQALEERMRKVKWTPEQIAHARMGPLVPISVSLDLVDSCPMPQKAIPKERRAEFLALAQQMVDEDITTPEAMVELLYSALGDNAPNVMPYAGSLWCIASAFIDPMPSTSGIDWAALFEGSGRRWTGHPAPSADTGAA